MNDLQPTATGLSNDEALTQTAADRFLAHLADRLGNRASTAAVYGEPVERNGVTVIPVARMRWGFAGGVGTGSNQFGPSGGQGSGVGGGGGVSASPMGYIEIANGRTEFRRIQDRPQLRMLVPVILATGISISFIALGLRLVLQARPRGLLDDIQRLPYQAGLRRWRRLASRPSR
jgi:uncharacterized spore protein YtfJ